MTHAEHSKKARNATPCTAELITFGGRCLACGWEPEPPKPEYRYMVKYVRHPRVQRAWGRKTKIHVYCLIFDTAEDARAVYRAARLWKGRMDSVWFKRTSEPASGVSVEDAKGLWQWKRLK